MAVLDKLESREMKEPDRLAGKAFSRSRSRATLKNRIAEELETLGQLTGTNKKNITQSIT